MELQDLKASITARISHFAEERHTKNEDYPVPGVGILKIASPLPKDFYDIMMFHGNAASDPDDKEASTRLAKAIVKASVVEPELDDEGVDMLLDVMGLAFTDLSNKCFNIASEANGIEAAVEKAEDFTDETPGPSSE